MDLDGMEYSLEGLKACLVDPSSGLIGAAE